MLETKFDTKKLELETILIQYESVIDAKRIHDKKLPQILWAQRNIKNLNGSMNRTLIESELKKKRQEHNRYLPNLKLSQKNKYVLARRNGI